MEKHIDSFKYIITTCGTRPDIIKIAPILKELSLHDNKIKNIIVWGKQHTDLAQEVFNVFNIIPHYSSSILSSDKMDLVSMLNFFMKFHKETVENILQNHSIDGLIVHGDVINSLAATLVAFFYKIPVFHIEAGLRTPEMNYPFPEEGTRRIISKIARLHFAPSEISKNNLLKEGVNVDNIEVVGNTVVDSLYLIINQLSKGFINYDKFYENFTCLDLDYRKKNIVLLTLHRREMWETDLFKEYLRIIGEFAVTHPEYKVVFPVHPNPRISKTVEEIRKNIPNINNIFIYNPPFPYHVFTYLLNKFTKFVLTDSGGVLEEASILGIPCAILRDTTERPEAQLQDPLYAPIIGDDLILLAKTLEDFSSNPYFKERKPNLFFGDGNSSKKIINKLLQFFNI